MLKLKSKIVLITYGNFPFGGASANLLRNLATGIKKQNYEIEVILPRGNYYGKKIERVAQKVNNIDGVKYRFLVFKRHPVNPIGKVLDNFIGPIAIAIYLVYLKINSRVDKILKYNITFTSQFLLLFVSMILNIKLINIVSEFYEKPSKKGLGLIKWYNFYYGFKYGLRFNSGSIALTTFLSSEIKKYNKKAAVLVQPNLIDDAYFNLPQNRNKEFLRIGYSGTPTNKDGIIDLLESFKIVNKQKPNTRLRVIGDLTNGTSLVSSLDARCKKLKIDKAVEFTGLVPHNEVPSLLNECDILVLARPSGIIAQAGFPTKLGEYFACKKPVVITRVGDIDYYFKDKKIVQIVEPENIKDIANGIIALIDDPKKRVKLGQAGYEWMLENLEYKNVAKKIHLYLNKL